MNKGLSIYLELIRVIATFLVLVSHAAHFAPQWLQLVFAELKLGRDGVILFFVLSGYVITWCGIEKETTIKAFALSRASRIYSVALPGLFLGIIASLTYTSINAEQAHYTLSKAWFYYPLFLTFNSQSWFGFLFPAGNFPYWSLSFEVWYYIFIGAILFTKRYKILFVILAVILMGPFIALFLPIWGLGAVLYLTKDKFHVPKPLCIILFVLSFLGFAVTKYLGFDDHLDQFNGLVLGSASAFLPASQFLGDYFLALIAVVNFYCAYHLNFTFNGVISKVIKLFAGFSFSTYMYHTPFFILLSCTPLVGFENGASYVLSISSALLFCYLLSLVTERKKREISAFLYHCIEMVLRLKRR
ncbi:acyltransferase [Alteromonas sp. CI.11.F.A3]|uniref:acyltransferase family protein n=1 Tax=Alteromonas sp. CI.11.F.A3 TaxID=3079555 RepID=UPI00294398B9|nr:acyltransferase [Alteromonas sp. CI.11.F.A3]WOI38743.1 acyltransferase [Alteromonas sp. CI.11.F.A3]